MQNLSVIEYDSSSKELRSNCWTFCIYPESMPKDYQNIISGWCIPCLISPVHDKDLNGNGMEKKPHIHIMMYFGARANKSYQQVMRFVDQLNGCPCEVVHNSVGMIRYFVHRDNPEKHQYKIEDLKAFFGFDYIGAFENNITDEGHYFAFLENFIEDNSIYNYYQLTIMLKSEGLSNELGFLRKHSTHIRFFLNDKYQLIKRCGDLQTFEKYYSRSV